jgi:hypothetical protein
MNEISIVAQEIVASRQRGIPVETNPKGGFSC